MTAADIHRAVKTTLFPEWVYLTEFRAGTGWSESCNRYLDAWAIQPWPSRGMGIVGIEVKISRSDFTRELSKPMKRDGALRVCNQFYFAAPVGLIEVEELPPEAGLITVADDKALILEEAPWRDILPTWPFVASLARRIEQKDTAMRALLLEYRTKSNCGEYAVNQNWTQRVDEVTGGHNE